MDCKDFDLFDILINSKSYTSFLYIYDYYNIVLLIFYSLINNYLKNYTETSINKIVFNKEI